MTRVAVKALLTLAVASAACLCLPPSRVFAGSYVVSTCSPSATSGLWARTNTFPTSFTTGILCGGPEVGPVDGSNRGAVYAEDILGSPTNMPNGTRAGWTFTAPSGTTITGIKYYRALAAHANNNMVAGLFQADGSMLEQCMIGIPLGSPIDCSKPNDQAPVTFDGLKTSALFVGVLCRVVTSGGGCGAGGTIHAVRAAMYSARVTLSEGSAPTLGGVGGELWGGGLVSGVVPVTFAASDPIGIREQLVRSDTGKTLISALQPCDFTLAQPCPQQPSGSLGVDTSRVPDGPSSFSLVVTDAAGNSQVATSPTVVVDNDGPPPPAAFSATAKGGGSNVIALAWRNPINAPAPVTAAQVQLCQGSCPSPVTVGSSGAGQVTAPGPGVYTVRLWLLDSLGRGGAHNAALASVTVPPAPTIGGSRRARTKIIGTLRGRTLRVAGTIARSGRVRVSWRSKVGSHTRGHGSRVVTIRGHKIAVRFRLTARARRGTIRVVVRSGTRVIAHALARRR
ncbi:MAG TPA: hypothetical protein VGO80_04990 [Solirubrobacteraceae bacterium]|jgi:hypothetical protein|nr:hypothetical protein [Solirubrobacteraceae bacterium]